MKKLLFSFVILFLALLVGCANFQPMNNQAPPAKTLQKPANKPTHNMRRANANGESAKISLNDFTDLSLNNDLPTSGNLWELVGQGLKIPNPESHPEVQAQIHWFMSHPSYLQRTTERARPYLYIVYQEVKNRNLPTELVLLPINESAYYPFSYSSTGATGIWQLMPGTASDFGLRRNFWYDGRRDIFDSTTAALDYLTYLAHYFNGDWLLAIAAYDTGEGNVQNAIARNLREGKPTDFWSLRLASETRSYVPRLLALAAIIAHPDRYPVALPPVDARPVVAPVHVDKQIKLTDAARLAGISLNQLKVLNPGLSKTATEPSGEAKLLLPIDNVESFKTNLNNFAPSEITQPQNFGHYRVQRGDTLQTIANRFGINVDDLRQANNILGRHVPTGKVLLIPNMAENFKPNTQINLDQTPLTLGEEVSPTPTAQAATTNDQRNDNAVSTSTPSVKHVIKHKVVAGETLSSISRNFHVSVKQLQRLNPNSARLHPGQVLIIETTNQPLSTPPARPQTHKSISKNKLHRHSNHSDHQKQKTT